MSGSFAGRSISLVLGDMLFAYAPGPSDSEIFMAEDFELCTRVRHHSQKLVLFLSAMRHARDRWRGQGREVDYHELDPNDPRTLSQRLIELATRRNATEIHTFVVPDREPRRRLIADLSDAGSSLIEEPNPMFLTPPETWQAFVSGSRRLLMADFYVQQRKRLSILIDPAKGPNQSPVGGKWSFDAENRKPLPKSVSAPAVWRIEPDPITREVIQLVQKLFPTHPGNPADFSYAVTREEALQWLDQFLEERLDLFGDYEDALSVRSEAIFHGILTPYLNCGLLTPAEVIDAALRRHTARPVPLNSLEGFLRQIIGWREFIKGIDHEYERRGITASQNSLGHTRQLGPAWWTGETGLLPLDLAIKKALDTGWCHHIERLMVLGSAMLMCEVEPAEAYRWFMEMFIDSADWVMGPNVLGMSQFADGGLFATKPYLSGSSYLRKMGDYPAGDWCEVWDGLYWRFVDRHRELFTANPRMSVMVGSLDKLDPSRRDRIFQAAEAFVEKVTLPAR